jgi:hypothetical protein
MAFSCHLILSHHRGELIGPSHRGDLGSVQDVSEPHAASVFKVCRVRQLVQQIHRKKSGGGRWRLVRPYRDSGQNEQGLGAAPPAARNMHNIHTYLREKLSGTKFRSSPQAIPVSQQNRTSSCLQLQSIAPARQEKLCRLTTDLQLVPR